MKVWENLTSRKGAQIEIHLEDENDGIFLEKEYSYREFQSKIRGMIEREKSDTGKGTVVHILINSQGTAKSMTAADYAEWQAKEEKDWFHGPHESVLVIHVIVDGPSSEGKFVGPTTEQLEEIFSDKKNRVRVSILNKKENHNCRLCLIPVSVCKSRRASYDHEDMKEALSKIN